MAGAGSGRSNTVGVDYSASASRSSSSPPPRGTNVLVYDHGALDTETVVKAFRGSKVSVVGYDKLVAMVEKDPKIRLSRKRLSRPFARCIEVKQHDLWTDLEKIANKDLPNYDTVIAEVLVDCKVWVQRALLGKLDELIILSRPLGLVVD